MTTTPVSTTPKTAEPTGSGPPAPLMPELAYRAHFELEEHVAGFMTSAEGRIY